MLADNERPPLVSVIMVTRNDREGVLRSLRSLSQSVKAAPVSIECIVKEGGTEGLQRSDLDCYPWAMLIGGEDRGTYDAMNIALSLSRGDFVWFLNGGDEAIVESWTGLEKCIGNHRGKMVFFDYLRHWGGRDEFRRARSPRSIWHALPTSHQAILYPGDAARQARYDLSYRVAADYAYTSALLMDGVRAEVCHQLVARFHVGGMSTARRVEIAADAERVQRTILHVPLPLRTVSRARHLLVRIYRRISDV